jgi:hypothetical protein
MARFVWTAVALQIAKVVAGHWIETVLNLSGVLGTLIPFGVGVVYGVRAEIGFGPLLRAGVVIGFMSSLVGVLLALFLGDATWLPLTWAPFMAAASGALGAAVGRVRGGAAIGG